MSGLPEPAARPGHVVRPAAVADVPHVAAIEQSSFADPWSRRSFAELLDRPEVYFVVAAAQPAPGTASPPGGVLGYAVAWFVVGEGEVANIAVHQGCRGQGVGASLLDDVLREAEARTVDTVFLEVRESNVPARALYASRDFHPVGRRRNYYRSPVEDALLLRRTTGTAGG